jgi:hypothetical protein
MLIKDLVAMIDKYYKMKDRMDTLRAKLRSFDPDYEDIPDDESDLDKKNWDIDIGLDPAGIRAKRQEIKDLIQKLQNKINKLDTEEIEVSPSLSPSPSPSASLSPSESPSKSPSPKKSHSMSPSESPSMSPSI